MYGWRLILAILIGSSAAWLIAAFAIHFGTIAPLRAGLISDRANALARQIDSVIKVRSTLISSAVNDQHLEKILDSAQLEALVKHIENRFSDFISLEVMNHRGEILAIVGEVALSKGNLAPLDIREALFNLDARTGNTGLLRDDPENDSFFITCRHRNSDGTLWYSRSRFGRSTLENILNHEKDKGSASLVPISGVSSDVRQIAENRNRIYNSWWSGLQAIEVSLESPGWMLKMVPNSSGSPVRRASVIIPGLLLLLFAAAYLIFARRENTYDAPDDHSSRTPSTVDKKSLTPIVIPEQKTEEEFIEKSPEPVSPAVVAAAHAIPPSVLSPLAVAKLVPVTNLPPSYDVDREHESSEVYSELLCPPQLVFAPMPDTFGLPCQDPNPKNTQEQQTPEIEKEAECPSEEYFCQGPEKVEPDRADTEPYLAEERMSALLEWSEDDRTMEPIFEAIPECRVEETIPSEPEKDMLLLEAVDIDEQPTAFAPVDETESLVIGEEECWVLEDEDVEVSDYRAADDTLVEIASEEPENCEEEEIIFPDYCIRVDSVQPEIDSGSSWKSIDLGPVTELLVTQDEYWIVSDDERQEDATLEAQIAPEIPEELTVEWDDEIVVPTLPEIPRDTVYAVLATPDTGIPEVLEVEWNEPVAEEESENPRKEREVILFSEFFNF
ncbi:hypothetical protein Desti_1538 [Desulfomonile tiedjei DSM 6799]|uniref:Uncharacterized protein n=2 Tax=Desulfomonile tiedjei TaxID=2358 RepID=I4C3V9_DESTA|nr:hypothetical protein Desti_1538 [Desulfomonile tiedjei DSM 6799]